MSSPPVEIPHDDISDSKAFKKKTVDIMKTFPPARQLQQHTPGEIVKGKPLRNSQDLPAAEPLKQSQDLSKSSEDVYSPVITQSQAVTNEKKVSPDESSSKSQYTPLSLQISL